MSGDATPSTWHQRLVRWLKPPRRLKFTREGKFLVGTTLGVGFAAINTGNNLLYLMLGLLLSLIVLSGVLSEQAIRGLVVRRRLPMRAQVGKPHLVEIEIFNTKLRMPSYAIEVEDLRQGQPADKRCFFLKISPRSSQVAAYRRTPARRGRDRHVGFRIATRFPFGLFEKSREVLAEDELVIYPATDPIALPTLSGTHWYSSDAAIRAGFGEDVIGIKPHRIGEDMRDVLWRKSAAAGQLVIRERGVSGRPDVQLVLDVRAPAVASVEWRDAFEARVREVASRAVAHLRRGDRIVLQTTAATRFRAERATGIDPVLRFLALVEPAPDDPTEPRRSE